MLSSLEPDIAIVVGDRYENMSFAIAAAYMNIKIIHTMGGEISGTIDESIRHAITKFSHIHFTASKDAYKRVIKMGENPKNVFHVGCPRIDLVKQVLKKKNINLDDIFEQGVGEKFDIDKVNLDGKYGYIVECDLTYPKKLHDLHQNLPLAPEVLEVNFNSLSPYAKKALLESDGQKKYKDVKLMATFQKRENYVTHFKNLKLYLDL
jgi:hypothetical protein